MKDATGWRPDVLGDEFEARTLELPGTAAATLVRHVPSVSADGAPARVAVLAVHGVADYFFHPHVARAIAEAGHACYAVDLRGHGRSWEAQVTAGGWPNQVPDVAVYAQDLDVAAAAVRAEGHSRLVVLGHSTGGLIASLWADARPGRADALVLNSPWFAYNAPALKRVLGPWAVSAVATVAPGAVVDHIREHYARAMHVSYGGEWDFDPLWKPLEPMPAHAAWGRSIARSLRRLQRGLDIDVPVLVLASDRTTPDEHRTSDTVLNVADIRRYAEHLGDDVSLVTVRGGSHDLSLSPAAARAEYLQAVRSWIAASV